MSARSRCKRMFRWCPQSTLWVQGTCLLAILGFFTTLMFGRSLTSTVQGTVGIIASIECYFAASRGDRKMLRYYGVVVLTGVDIECASAHNVNACASAQVVYGLIMALGASSVGLFAAINTTLVSLTMPAQPPPDPFAQLLVKQVRVPKG